MQAAVDVEDDLAFAGERASLVVGESPGMRDALRDFTIAVELRQVLGRRDRGVIEGPALAALAGLEQLDVPARRGKLLEVRDRLVVRRQPVVLPRRKTPH